MQVELTYNETKSAIELLFSAELTTAAKQYLKRIGFAVVAKNLRHWCAKQTPAYLRYSEDLRDALLKGEPIESVHIKPSFRASEQHIEDQNFSLVVLDLDHEETSFQDSYVVFDRYKKVVTAIARRYATIRYGQALKSIHVYPRTYREQARRLLNEGRVITGDTPTPIAKYQNNALSHLKDEPLANSESPTPESRLKEVEPTNENEPEAQGEKSTLELATPILKDESLANSESPTPESLIKEVEPTNENEPEAQAEKPTLELAALTLKDESLANSESLTPEPSFKEDLTILLDQLELDESVTQATVEKPKDSEDYLGRVVAHMHEQYYNSQRLTKGQIEKLADTLNVPNMGMMWEAVELSWLLWYQMLYRQPIPFHQRLGYMSHFWDKVQPSYQYSDSDKEVHQQYSTPCPIAAIIAEYTQMKQAAKIFEPSAGNGLLVLGADPNKTHVNEIDKSRLASLRHQGFQQITSLDASQPFPEEMTHAYDVVVTNPPFNKWEASQVEKTAIVRTLFSRYIKLIHHARLEHIMAGLALRTLKDSGRAAIILMGHVHFDERGQIAKYRPFFNWLYSHYHVDDVINLNSYKLYNKQGAVARTMLILINGRKANPSFTTAPSKDEAPYLETIVESFQDLWQRVSLANNNLDLTIKQLNIAVNTN